MVEPKKISEIAREGGYEGMADRVHKQVQDRLKDQQDQNDK